jgi:DNA-binding transcriptional MerR regulator
MKHHGVMKIRDALIWYNRGLFTAEDVTRATGISESSQRLLQKLGVITPAPQVLRTSKRLFYADAVKRLACIKPLSDCGLSLTVAGKIVYACPMVEDLLFGIIDPIDAMFDVMGELDTRTKLPPLRETPDPDGLFGPKPPVLVGQKNFWVEVLNRRFVGVKSVDHIGGVIGELTADGSEFVAWYGHVFDSLFDNAERMGFRATPPAFRTYKPKRPTKADLLRAEHVLRNPASRVSVNVGVALLVALRRLLFIDSAVEGQD